MKHVLDITGNDFEIQYLHALGNFSLKVKLKIKKVTLPIFSSIYPPTLSSMHPSTHHSSVHHTNSYWGPMVRTGLGTRATKINKSLVLPSRKDRHLNSFRVVLLCRGAHQDFTGAHREANSRGKVWPGGRCSPPLIYGHSLPKSLYSRGYSLKWITDIF